MKEKFITTWFYADTKTVKTVGVETTHIETEQYANSLKSAYKEFDEKGYDVVNVTPINVGVVADKNIGFSLTRGAVVLGKLREG